MIDRELPNCGEKANRKPQTAAVGQRRGPALAVGGLSHATNRRMISAQASGKAGISLVVIAR